MLDPTICPQCFQPNEPERKLCWKCMRSMAEPALESDYIRIFKLKGNWTRDELKVAFRSQARKFHPDANPGNREADSYFKFVNQAYEVMSRRADELAKNKAEGKAPEKPAGAAHADMASDDLNQKLRNVIRWGQSQKEAEKTVKKSAIQKITQSLNNIWPFKGKS